MATNTAIVSGGSLVPVAGNTARVARPSLSAVAANTAIVAGASLSSAGSTNRARVASPLLMNATVEPFSTVQLPGDAPWFQTAGPPTATPAVLMPGVPNPGTTVTYRQANGTTLSFKVLPHTIFGRDDTGKLFPIRKRPYLGAGTVDPGPTAPASLTGIHVGNLPDWLQVSLVDFSTIPDFPVGTLTSNDSQNSRLTSTDPASLALRDKLRFYQAGHQDTDHAGVYDPARFSHANGVLTLNQAIVNGVPTGGHFHPVVAGQEGTSGAWRLPTPGIRYRICMRMNSTDPHWGGVALAIALTNAEDDFPEGGSFGGDVRANIHNIPSGFDPIGPLAGVSMHDWHIFDSARIPSSAAAPSVTYQLDNTQIFQTTNATKIGNDTMSVHFQAATDGTAPAAGTTGTVDIAWVEVYQYAPGT